MEISQLKSFKKVAELEHMTKAADELHIAQPALSKTIRILESELNAQLFDRIGKNIILNKNGEIFLKHVNSILNELENIHLELDECNHQAKKEVIISMQAASKWLPELIAGFQHLHPETKISIVQHNNTEKKDECDLCIDSSRDKIDSPNTCTLLKEDILLALPKTHPLAYRKAINLSEVKNESFISLQKGQSLSKITNEYCNSVGFEPNILLESDDPATIRGLINLGIGISFIPKITWQGVADNTISLVKISQPKCIRYINLAWKENRYLSESVELFKKYTISFFEKICSSTI